LQKLSDADPSACPACGADAVKRQVTAPSFRLAGSGWYETDFKKDGDRKRNLSGEGGQAADAVKPAATPAETKAAKPGATPGSAPAPKTEPAAKPAAGS